MRCRTTPQQLAQRAAPAHLAVPAQHHTAVPQVRHSQCLLRLRLARLPPRVDKHEGGGAAGRGAGAGGGGAHARQPDRPHGVLLRAVCHVSVRQRARQQLPRADGGGVQPGRQQLL